jgi:hypothetical protein
VAGQYDAVGWSPSLSAPSVGAFDGSHFPPLQPAGVDFFPFYMYGWPTNSGTAADLSGAAARLGLADKTVSCFETRNIVPVGATASDPAHVELQATRDSNNHFQLPWTGAGLVQSWGKAFQGFGYFEGVYTQPAGVGVWTALWLLTADRVWPPEIDIVENVNHAEDPSVPSTSKYHVGTIGNGGAGGFVDTRADLTAAPHKYAALVTASTVSFYFDDVLISTQATPSQITASSTLYMLAEIKIGAADSWPRRRLPP